MAVFRTNITADPDALSLEGVNAELKDRAALDASNNPDAGAWRTAIIVDEARSILRFGARAGAADNKAAFDLADAAPFAVYVPDGDFDTSIIPTGLYYGDGTVTVAGEVFYLCAVPTRLNVNTVSGFRSMNLTLGQAAGDSMGPGSRSTTAMGAQALTVETSPVRVTVFGAGGLRYATNVNYVDVFGAGAMNATILANRVAVFGTNSAKWLGILDPIASAHIQWFDDENNTYNNWVTSGYLARNPNAADIFQPPLSRGGALTPISSIPGAVPYDGIARGFPLVTSGDDVEGNCFFGRDSGQSLVRGTNNLLFGYQAGAGFYTTSSCIALGRAAHAQGAAAARDIVIGNYAFQLNQTGTDTIVIGHNSYKTDVFGIANTILGCEIGGLMVGTANSNKRNVFAGFQAALNKTDGNDNVAIGVLSLGNNAAGAGNVAIGSLSGQNYTGNNGIFIGNGADVYDSSIAVPFVIKSNANAIPALDGDLTNANVRVGGALTTVGRLCHRLNFPVLASAAGISLSASDVVESMIRRSGAAAVTDTLPTAAAIVAFIPLCKSGVCFEFEIINSNSGLLTIAAGTGVTLAGVTTVAAGFTRKYIGRVVTATAGSEAVSIYGVMTAAV